LKKKASERNPDEFYFKMKNSQVQDSKHKELKNGSIDIDTLKHFKTQDQGYLNYKKSFEMKKIEKMRENLHFIDTIASHESGPARKNHKIFVSNANELSSFDPEQHFHTPTEMLSRSCNRSSIENIQQLADKPTSSISIQDIKRVNSSISSQYTELKQRIKRLKKIDAAVGAVSLQRNLMGKGSKRKIEVDGPNGKTALFKWKRERLR